MLSGTNLAQLINHADRPYLSGESKGDDFKRPITILLANEAGWLGWGIGQMQGGLKIPSLRFYI